jgi:hypothetical protein
MDAVASMTVAAFMGDVGLPIAAAFAVEMALLVLLHPQRPPKLQSSPQRLRGLQRLLQLLVIAIQEVGKPSMHVGFVEEEITVICHTILLMRAASPAETATSVVVATVFHRAIKSSIPAESVEETIKTSGVMESVSAEKRSIVAEFVEETIYAPARAWELQLRLQLLSDRFPVRAITAIPPTYG